MELGLLMRDKIYADYREGASTEQIAQKHQLAPLTVQRMINQARQVRGKQQVTHLDTAEVPIPPKPALLELQEAQIRRRILSKIN